MSSRLEAPATSSARRRPARSASKSWARATAWALWRAMVRRSPWSPSSTDRSSAKHRARAPMARSSTSRGTAAQEPKGDALQARVGYRSVHSAWLETHTTCRLRSTSAGGLGTSRSTEAIAVARPSGKPSEATVLRWVPVSSSNRTATAAASRAIRPCWATTWAVCSSVTAPDRAAATAWIRAARPTARSAARRPGLPRRSLRAACSPLTTI